MAFPISIGDSGKLCLTSNGDMILKSGKFRVYQSSISDDDLYISYTHKFNFNVDKKIPFDLLSSSDKLFFLKYDFIPISGGEIKGTINDSVFTTEDIYGITNSYYSNFNHTVSIKDIEVIGIVNNFGGIKQDGGLCFIPVFKYKLEHHLTHFIPDSVLVSAKTTLDIIMPSAVISNNRSAYYNCLLYSDSNQYYIGNDIYDIKVIKNNDPYVHVDRYENFKDIANGNYYLLYTKYFRTYSIYKEPKLSDDYSVFFSDSTSPCRYGRYETTINNGNHILIQNFGGSKYDIPAIFLSGTVTFPIEKLRRAITWEYKGD